MQFLHNITLKSSVRSIFNDGARANRILLFVDALDECTSGSSISDIIRFLSEISQGKNPENIRIAFTSRSIPHEYIANQFGGFRLEDRNRSDISKFIKDMWDSTPIPQGSTSEFPGLRSELIIKSDGIFLWARLALNKVLGAISDGATVSEIQDTINGIPRQSRSIFAMLLHQVDSKHLDQSVTMLSMVLSATRPLTLREFRFILALNNKNVYNTQADLESSPNFIRGDDIMARRIRSRCGGLLEVRHNNDSWQQANLPNSFESTVVQLLHQSVEDFLTVQNVDAEPELPVPKALQADGHVMLASLCIKYLAFEEVQELPSRWSDRIDSEVVLQELHLLRYAVENWAYHCRQAEKLGWPQGDVLESSFGTQVHLFNNWRQIHGHLHTDSPLTAETSLLHVAIENVPSSYVELQCAKSNFDINAWVSRHGGFLHLAIINNSARTVKVL